MTTFTQTTNLVLSFSGTLAALRRGDVTVSDLDGALFYLGCTRNCALDPAVASANCYDVSGPEYQQLREAILTAETEGRVEWRELGQYNSFDQLNEFLNLHELPPLVPTGSYLGYSYPEVQEIIKQDGLPYQVIGVY